MPKFSKSSLDKLQTCERDIVIICNEVIKFRDCKVLYGYRDEVTQNKLFNSDPPVTKARWPQSKHNKFPSLAVDLVPWPIPEDWGRLPWPPASSEDMRYRARIFAQFYEFAGYVMATVDQFHKEGKIDTDLKWGGDWNMNLDFNDQRFHDLPHFQLV